MQDFYDRHEPLPVSRWARDDALCQISARDARGQVLMAIHAGPGFAARLAAAFCARPGVVAPTPTAASRFFAAPPYGAPLGQKNTPLGFIRAPIRA